MTCTSTEQKKHPPIRFGLPTAALQFIDSWANQLGVHVLVGDFDGEWANGHCRIRQVAGWGTIPIAFSNGDGSWNITNVDAPQFIDECRTNALCLL